MSGYSGPGGWNNIGMNPFEVVQRRLQRVVKDDAAERKGAAKKAKKKPADPAPQEEPGLNPEHLPSGRTWDVPMTRPTPRFPTPSGTTWGVPPQQDHRSTNVMANQAHAQGTQTRAEALQRGLANAVPQVSTSMPPRARRPRGA